MVISSINITSKRTGNHMTAEQFLPPFNIPAGVTDVSELPEGYIGLVETVVGRSQVHECDWIVTGTSGQKYIYTSHEFERQYRLTE